MQHWPLLVTHALEYAAQWWVGLNDVGTKTPPLPGQAPSSPATHCAAAQQDTAHAKVLTVLLPTTAQAQGPGDCVQDS